MNENNNSSREDQRNIAEEKLKELTDKLEDGVKAVRNSDEFKSLITTMAKFPHYSLNNCMLIAMQRPDATLCQSYGAWKKMGRYVRKGEKGIRVIAPAPYTIEKEVDKLDANGKVILDKDGEPVKEKKELNLMSFKAESTFDISQTEGKDLPRLGVDELVGEVDKYEMLMGVLREISPVPIGFENIQSGAKGYYHVEDKRIAIQVGMSELQTLKTCLHEVTHAMLHAEAGNDISRNRKELEAEGTAAVVLSFFNYDTSDYSHPYLASYTTDDTLKEFKESLGTIRKTSAKIIRAVEEKLKEHEQSMEKEQPVEKMQEQNAEDIVADDSQGYGNVGRRILGTVRILPDGEGGSRPSLLDKLRIERDRLSKSSFGNNAVNEKGVRI